MGVTQALLLSVSAVFLVVALIRIFRTPLRLTIRLLSNTALGFLALWFTNLAAPVTGLALGVNFWNALTVAILGLPGLFLLLLLRWIL